MTAECPMVSVYTYKDNVDILDKINLCHYYTTIWRKNILAASQMDIDNACIILMINICMVLSKCMFIKYADLGDGE